MENKIFIIGLIIFTLFVSISSVCADDNLENSTLTTFIKTDENINQADLYDGCYDCKYEINSLGKSNENQSCGISIPSKDNLNDNIISASEISDEISITSENYDQYFNIYTGKFKNGIDSSKISTIKIGNVSNCIFTFEKPINLMPMDSSCQITNGVIHLLPGSDGSTISSLKIINNDSVGDIKHEGILISRAHGIWFTNSSYNLIYNCTIIIGRQHGCYAMPMGYSNNNKIINNTIISGLTSCIVMGRCNNNDISYNYVEILDYEEMTTSNLIFFNPWGHADYHDGGAECNGNYISNNYFKNFGTGNWAVTLSLGYYSGDTQVINNTVIKGSVGIQLTDMFTSQPKNITVKGNTIINSSCGLSSGSNGIIIDENRFYGISEGCAIGIQADDLQQRYYHNITISNNYIEYKDLSCAIEIHTDNATVFNNKIHLSRYGIGIGVSPTDIPEATSNNCIIKNNEIYVYGDSGIKIYGNNTEISNNYIATNNKGIIVSSNKNNYYNTTIIGNIINSDDYGIYVEGHVYNTLIMYNEIESNQSEGIHFNPSGDLGEYYGNISENTINGIIENTETLIINDTNFYDYFDNTGYLNYEFKPNSKRIIFFTFLTNKNIYFTDQIILTSNKMANLLYNVSIKLTADASNSSIQDFKFYNFDKSSIILDDVDGVIVKNNDFTVVSSDIFDISTISINCGNECELTNNNIFMNSKASYTYAILFSGQNKFIKKQSKNFTISNNNILIKSTGVAEGIYADTLVESNIVKNTINIISNSSSYGIAICKIFERPYNITIDSNLIAINSKDMSYLIEIHMSDTCDIINNYLIGYSNGIYGVGVYNSWDININRNEICITGNSLTDSPVADALGKGNVAIYMNKSSKISSLSRNILDVENANSLVKDTSSVINNFNYNNYVIAEYNYDIYFNSQNKLINNVIKDDSIILFKNFTSPKIMDITIPVSIKPYKHLNNFSATLILSDNAHKSTISGFNFNNAKIEFNKVNNINIYDNSFISSKIIDIGGFKNHVFNNSFEFNLNNTNGIIFEECVGDIFSNNHVSIDSNTSNFIFVKRSNETEFNNNYIDAMGNSIHVIYSNSSYNTKIFENKINITSNYDFNVYSAYKATTDEILYNVISSNSISNRSVIYYDSSSSNNKIEYNNIISFSSDGSGYAIIFDTEYPLSNIIANNYLISSNGYRRGNDAVYAVFELVCNNTPVTIYVSANSSDDGNGTFENPYSTIKEAIENCLSGAIIYILPGYYNESNLTIDKNITLTAINNDGSVYIDALNNKLFTITKSGSLTINALKIFNGFSVEGGSLFNNLGFLTINNSIIYNSSSYYDNSHPTFKFSNIKTRNIAYSYDCENLGLGGAIFNYGNLFINSSTVFDNFAHKGGFLANFGKTSIKNSLIFNNTAVHGGAIFTDSSYEFNIENTIFLENIAIQTLDYCYIQRQSLESGGYIYRSLCDMRTGYGGAIFSNSNVIIVNSLFERNVAKSGGAIGQYSWIEETSYNSLGPGYFAINENIKDESRFHYVPKLTVENSVFRYNEAKDTSCGNLSMIKDIYGYSPYYSINYNGGAIFGGLNQLILKDSLFEHNVAHTVGGALSVQCENSIIEGCKFYNNTAGECGGAIESFGTFKIFNTEILDNHAKYGGAIKYTSYNSYGHTQKIMDIFNVTVAGNTALAGGGAFVTSVSNFVIKNSNIYNNKAPNNPTFIGGSSNIDARNNWWGSVDGPDDSVWNAANSRFRTWLSEQVDWDTPHVDGGSSNDDTPGSENKNNAGSSHTSPHSSTGSGVHTGSTLTNNINSYGTTSKGFTFPGNWPSGNFNGFNNNGSGESISSNGNSGNSKNNIFGNVNNPNSLSQVNSSNVNDLSSVGMTANAADSTSSDQSSSSTGSGENGGRVYEITPNIKKEVVEKEDLSIFNILFILLWIFLFIGFYRKYKDNTI